MLWGEGSGWHSHSPTPSGNLLQEPATSPSHGGSRDPPCPAGGSACMGRAGGPLGKWKAREQSRSSVQACSARTCQKTQNWEYCQVLYQRKQPAQQLERGACQLSRSPSHSLSNTTGWRSPGSAVGASPLRSAEAVGESEAARLAAPASLACHRAASVLPGRWGPSGSLPKRMDALRGVARLPLPAAVPVASAIAWVGRGCHFSSLRPVQRATESSLAGWVCWFVCATSQL